jgi:hypothetical protein
LFGENRLDGGGYQQVHVERQQLVLSRRRFGTVETNDGTDRVDVLLELRNVDTDDRSIGVAHGGDGDAGVVENPSGSSPHLAEALNGRRRTRVDIRRWRWARARALAPGGSTPPIATGYTVIQTHQDRITQVHDFFG